MNWITFIIVALLLAAAAYLILKGRRNSQLAYIKGYHFHNSITTKLQTKYPHLTDEQTHLVFRGLRDYFFMCNRAYRRFCHKALGRFLHHTPAEAMSAPTMASDGIKRAWRLACAKERIDPTQPNRLPLIFAIDAMLEIPRGFTYSINCKDKNSPTYGSGYCASDIGCSGGCAGDGGAGCGGGCGGD